MKVLVDTCVWSLALRRRKTAKLNPEEQRLARLLTDAIQNGQVAIMGPIRQEVLSGIRDKSQFNRTEIFLAPFPDEELAAPDYIEAARCYNLCRDQGVECGPVDILICAVALRRQSSVLTNDQAISRCLGVLQVPRL